jgi:hypothetical protein
MAPYDNTREAARQMQGDAKAAATQVKTDFRTFFANAAQRLGVVGDDARRLADDAAEYFTHWGRMVKEDVSSEAKTTARNLALTLSAAFVASLGFLLLNMGVIWTLSATDTGVGPWFIIFGCAWIVVGAIIGLTALFSERKSVNRTKELLREDVQIPKRHAQTVTQRLQEGSNGSPTTH